MAKIRVHELAKELDRTNKEVMDYLVNKGVDVKSHMSLIPDDVVDQTRKAFSSKAASPESGSEEKPKPKKKNIIRVFRSQNASGSIPERKPRRPEGQKRPDGQRKPGMRRPDGTRPEGARPQGVRPEAAKPEQEPAKTVPAQEPVKAAPVQEPVKAPAQEPVKAAPAQEPVKTAPVQEPVKAAPAQEPVKAAPVQKNQASARNQQDRSRDRAQGNNQERSNYKQRENGQERGSYQNRDRSEGGNRGSFQGRGDGQNRGQFQRRQDGGTRNQGQNRDRSEGGNRSSFQGRGDGQNRINSQNRSDAPKGFGKSGEGRDSRENRDNRDNRSQGGRSFGGNRTPARSAVEVPDAPLLKKPSRDPRKDSKEKERDKNREQVKENGRRPNQSNRPNQSKKQFNRIPKALEKPTPKQKQDEKKEAVTEVVLPEKMTIRELADAIKMQPSVIVKKLFMEGILVTVNHEIDFEKAQEICLDYEIIAEQEEKVDVIEELLREEEEDESLLIPRPPVVCVMGHVDHGKTSLLDAIRNTHVTDREAGGITQHIGAYTVSIDGQKITFLDTPGHEAFTAMRMRGANATDIAILVVAADDGVMPQTIEAINHAKAAGVEIIVAVNKIDKPSANVERVKQEMTEYGLIAEDWGGSTVFAPVSAHTKEGIDNLLEMILLTAEMMELKANPKRKARGLVIEAQLDKGKGPVATILVQKGTLKVGDFIACGAASGKVRAMMDDKGRRVKEAGPSTPVEILGLSDVPNAGEVLVATNSDKEAKEFAATFISENKNKLLDETKTRMSLDDLFNQIQEGNLKELPIVVKADVQGSVEAVKQSLVKLSNEEVIVKVIHGGVGAINESDVTLASASNAIIIGFNVRPDATAKAIAEQEGIDLRLYKVIYQAIEDVEAAMKGMLDAVYEEKVIGHAVVRQIFKASGVGNIAGSYVTDGEFQRGALIRIRRGEEQIYEGKLASLKRFKDDVKEVKTGFECGLVFEEFQDFQVDDIVEAYIMVEVPR
ncbi:MAG: translation initiation factor IF-2 [Lachnospiraceae bacterium]|nr:translation initiation factor IF-2 [Lachnospiraceae bacterium]